MIKPIIVSCEIKSRVLESIKGAVSGLCFRQFLSTKSPLKIMKNAFYFTLKAILVLKILRFSSSLFGHVEKRLD